MKLDRFVLFFPILFFFAARAVSALDLDWSGQFRAEQHFVFNYASGEGEANIAGDSSRAGQGGYSILGGGEENASFQIAFLKLNPKVIVNDNVNVFSEFHIGSPITGIFGSGLPYSSEQKQFYSTQVRGIDVLAQRFWLEAKLDFGTLKLGRAPLHYGLGMIWNSGDGLWDRYQSTGDQASLQTKFGSFLLQPSFIKTNSGASIGGACLDPTQSPCIGVLGTGHSTDYSILLMYDSPEEQVELGLNFIKRIAGSKQDPNSSFLLPKASETAMNYNIWDVYARKTLGPWTIGAEVPFVSGELGSLNYSTFAAALESDVKIADSWAFGARFGYLPGQKSHDLGTDATDFTAFFQHPARRVGMILFNYQRRNFSGPNIASRESVSQAAVLSPFDAPVTNSNYLSLNGRWNYESWGVYGAWTAASAQEVAEAGKVFYNTWDRKFNENKSGATQGSFLGWEADAGVSYQWDSSLQALLDFGLFFPGEFYEFSNTSTLNDTAPVFATSLKVGVEF